MGDYRRSAIGAAGDRDRALDPAYALAHAKQAKSSGIGHLFLRDAAAIVLDAQQQLILASFYFHLHLRGVSMTDNIGQCFLQDPKKRAGSMVRQPQIVDWV